MIKIRIVRYFIYTLWKQKIFSHLEIRKIKYSLEVILNELLKLVVLILIFASLKSLEVLLFSLVFLIPIRIFSGGIHFESSFKCLIFTAGFFLLILAFYPLLPSKNPSLYFLSFISLTLITIFSPAPNEYRPNVVQKNRATYKMLAFAITLGSLALLYLLIESQKYFAVGFITIMLQATQLIINYFIRFIFNLKRRNKNEIIL